MEAGWKAGPGIRTVKEGAQLLQTVSRAGSSQADAGFFSSNRVNGSGQDLQAAEGNDRTWVLVAHGWSLKGRVTGDTHSAWPGNRVQGDAVNPYHVSDSRGEEN